MVPTELSEVLDGIHLKGKRIPAERFDAKNYAITSTDGEYGCDCGACDNGGYCIDSECA